MLCYRIIKNNQEQYVAGSADSESIQFSVYKHQATNGAYITAIAIRRNSDGSIEQLEWQSSVLRNGDFVTVELVDCESADPPDRIVSYGTRIHPDVDQEMFCSFCGKSQSSVSKLISGAGGNICNECIDLCVKEMNR